MILRESGEQQIKGYAADIQSSGKMLLSVINDILDFSKIESGKMELVPSDYELSCLVSDLVNMIAARAEAKGLAFVINVDGKTPRQLYGDDTRIKQCVLNILTNAVKYTPEGSVTLDIGAERLDDSRCSLYFSVRDTGIGIKEEDIQKLFSPFERIEEGRNKAIEGTGLGMSIVKSLLAAMGTHLEVESVYGEGSRFSFRVQQQVKDWEPVGNWEEAKMRSVRNAGAYTESFQAPGAKVLVVDDTPVNLTVMKGLLKQTRIQIDTAEDGVEGLEKSKAGKYDVIFIDHRMPRMDGMEMVAALRADGENVNRQSVCVALTANTVGDVRGQYIGAGFEDYLAKPVDPKRLESMLVQYLPPELVLHEGDEGWLASDGRAAGGQAAAGQDASGQASDGSPAWGESPAQGGPEDSVPGLAMDRMVLDAAAAFFERRFGLDLAAALMNCGNEDVFQDVLKVFHASIGEKAGCIERYAAEGNWQDYTVLVHALKSSARLIGAGKLSEAAAELEALGNRARSEGDEEAAADIRARTPELLAAYRAYGELLAPLVI